MSNKIRVKIVRMEFGNEEYAPVNEMALHACYLVNNNILTTKDLKILTLMGHEIEVTNLQEVNHE